MTRVLIRTYRDPFVLATPEDVHEQGLLGGNNGNLVFSDAAVKSLSIDGVELHCQTLDDHKPDPAEVNEQFDHVVLPFANAFRYGYRRYLEDYTKWLRQLKVPVTVLGVGAQGTLDYSYEQLVGRDGDVKAFVGAVLDRGPSIGVRGEFSAHYLRHLGFDDVEVIGCPSMFTHGPDLRVKPVPERFDEHSLVAFNYTPRLDLPVGMIHGLADRYPRLTYFPQHAVDLERMLWGRAQGDGRPHPTNRIKPAHRALYSCAEPRLHVNPAAWMADLARFDFSLGTRIHGNLVAMLAGTPAHVIAHDSRTRELAEYFEVPHTLIDDMPVDVDLDKLTADHDYSATARGHRPRFDRYVAYLEAHGLAHAWQPGAQSTWEEQVRDQPLPREVAVTTVDLVARLGWLKRRQDRQIASLRRRGRMQALAVKRMQRQVDQQGARLAELEQQVNELTAGGRRGRWMDRARRFRA